MNSSITKFILDIGNTKVKLFASELDDGGDILRILSYVEVETEGMKKNKIENAILLSKSIEKAVNQMKTETGLIVKNINIGYNGNGVFSKTKNIRFDLGEEKTVTEADIEKMFSLAKEKLCTSDDEVIEKVIYNTKINNSGVVKNPIGLTAKYLTGDIHLICVKKDELNEFMEVFHRVGLSVESVTLNAYAAAKSTLSWSEKVSGIALIDIGESTTDIIIYKNDKFIYTKSLPLGGRHYISDLVHLFELEPKEAVSIIEKTATTRNGYYIIGDKEILIEDITNAFNARTEDFKKLILKSIEESGFQDYLESGIKITGGVSKMKEMCSWLQSKMKYKVSSASTPSVLGMPNPTPQMAVGLGIVLEVMEREYQNLKNNKNPFSKENIKVIEESDDLNDDEEKVDKGKGIMSKMKKMLSNFI